MKNITQRYGLMKLIGGLYIALAALILLASLALSIALLRGDFYADYRRGMHIVLGLGAFLVGAMVALGFYVQGSLANAVADIDKNTRVNGEAIEASREATEKAVRTGQTAIKNSEAMLHAQAALQAAAAETAAHEPAAAVMNAADPRVEIVPPVAASAPPLAPSPMEAAVQAVEAMKERSAELDAMLGHTVEAERSTQPAADMPMSGAVGIAGSVRNASDESLRLDDAASTVTIGVATADDNTDPAVKSLFARAKGAVVRTRRPWARENEQ
jgi:hypothetical protein